MLKHFIRFAFLLIVPNHIFATDKGDIDNTYKETFIENYENSILQGLNTADSIYDSTDKSVIKAKSLMFSAKLYTEIGDFKKSISIAEDANTLCRKFNLKDLQLQILIFLAEQYRLVGLYDRAESYILQGLKISTENENNYSESGILNQQLALKELELSHSQYAVRYLNLSLEFFSKSNQKDFNKNMALSYQLLGDAFFQMKEYDKSENYYKQAEAITDHSSYRSGFIYNGLGAIRLKQNRLRESGAYLVKAYGISENFTHPELKKKLYPNLSEYYGITGNTSKSSQFALDYISVINEINSRNQRFISSSYAKIDEYNKNYKELSHQKNIIISVLGITLLSLLLFFLLKKRKQNKNSSALIKEIFSLGTEENLPKEDRSYFINTYLPVTIPEESLIHAESDKKTVFEAETSPEEAVHNVEIVQNREPVKKRSDSIMTPGTETKLLDLLDEFEKSNLYNCKNMSLPFLSGQLNTNTKYLSHVINKHKNADFKTYINTLRIKYIVDKLSTDEIYRQYKISILAEECGFSSHSKFASVFRSIIGFSPSVYIKQIEMKSTQKDVCFTENGL